MTNTDAVIHELCTSTGTNLYSLIGARCWNRFPNNEVWANQTPAIIYTRDSIESHTSNTEHTVGVRFSCYGGQNASGALGTDEADAVFRALHDRLHALGYTTLTSGNVRRVLFDTASVSVEPETGWPYVTARFQFKIEEN
jgi:hypothetical protein